MNDPSLLLAPMRPTAAAAHRRCPCPTTPPSAPGSDKEATPAPSDIMTPNRLRDFRKSRVWSTVRRGREDMCGCACACTCACF